MTAAARMLESAAAGDGIAFARIVEAHDDAMYRVCMVVARDPTIAADAVQAAWTIAWRRLRTIREPERLRAWLVAIAVNETKTLIRRRGRRARLEVTTDAAGSPGGHDPATGIDSLDLRSALERLDPDDRALLAMRYVAGFTATDLAAALGISPSGTRTRIARAAARLRQELE